jgi:hypothetical protein
MSAISISAKTSPLVTVICAALLCIGAASPSSAQRRPGAAAHEIAKEAFEKYRRDRDAEVARQKDPREGSQRRAAQLQRLADWVLSDRNATHLELAAARSWWQRTNLLQEENSRALPVQILAAHKAFRADWRSLFAVAVVDLVPRSADEFKAVYESDSFSMQDQSELQTLKKDDEESLRKLARFSIDEALGSERQLIVIVGHNKGGLLVDPAGGKHSLKDLALKCAEFLKFCIFLSCEAKDFIGPEAAAPSVKIGAREALEMARAIQLMADKALEVVEEKAGKNQASESQTAFRILLQAVQEGVENMGQGGYKFYVRQTMTSSPVVAILIVALLATSVNCDESDNSC